MRTVAERPKHRAASPALPAGPQTTEASLPTIICATTILIYLSVALTALSMTDLANVIPPGVRALAVVVVAVTLPGLPAAALLRLPFNGVFASVTVSVSLAATVLLAQSGAVTGRWDPVVQQLLLVMASAVLTLCLLRRYLSAEPPAAGYLTGLLVALRYSAWGSLVTLAGAVVLFGVAVARLDVSQSGAYGLITTLGVPYFAGLAAVCAVLAVEYRRIQLNRPATAAANVVLLGYMTMPAAWAQGLPPFPTAFVHQYIADWIARLGELPPPVDARISWSGFFSAAAHLADIADLADTKIFLPSASLFFGILLIFPVYAIGRALTDSEHVAWLGVTMFIAANWYQQDYFAPQALAMQLYVTVLAVLLWQWRSAQPGGTLLLPVNSKQRYVFRMPARVPGTNARWTIAIELVLLLLIAAVVVSHQLTPLVLIGSLLALSLLGATRHKLLWVAAVLFFCAWFTFGAEPYWRGHFGELIDDIGAIGASLDAGVSDRLAGDAIYGRMQLLRVGAAITLFSLGVIGLLRIRRSPYASAVAALAVIPFLLIAVQSYGGEVVIRCFLYATPLLAPLAAIALNFVVSHQMGRRRLGYSAAAVAVLLALTLWGVTNRGLNTAFEHTKPAELAVSERLVSQAPPGVLMYWGQGSLLGLPRGHDLGPECIVAQRDLADCTAGEGGDYLILTTQDRNYLYFRYRLHDQALRAAIERLIAHHGFEQMYADADALVLKRPGALRLNLQEPQ